MNDIEQYKELLSSLINCLTDDDLTYHEECGICYSLNLCLNIDRATKMIECNEYKTIDDKIKEMETILEGNIYAEEIIDFNEED